MRLVEFSVNIDITDLPEGDEASVRIDPRDVALGLNGNDELVLQFVCQLVALTHSLELREQLLQRLGVEPTHGFHSEGAAARYDEQHWQDEDYLPQGPDEELRRGDQEQGGT